MYLLHDVTLLTSIRYLQQFYIIHVLELKDTMCFLCPQKLLCPLCTHWLLATVQSLKPKQENYKLTIIFQTLNKINFSFKYQTNRNSVSRDLCP